MRLPSVLPICLVRSFPTNSAPIPAGLRRGAQHPRAGRACAASKLPPPGFGLEHGGSNLYQLAVSFVGLPTCWPRPEDFARGFCPEDLTMQPRSVTDIDADRICLFL